MVLSTAARTRKTQTINTRAVVNRRYFHAAPSTILRDDDIMIMRKYFTFLYGCLKKGRRNRRVCKTCKSYCVLLINIPYGIYI